jgi:hypothetical protein
MSPPSISRSPIQTGAVVLEIEEFAIKRISNPAETLCRAGEGPTNV